MKLKQKGNKKQLYANIFFFFFKKEKFCCICLYSNCCIQDVAEKESDKCLRDYLIMCITHDP